MNMIKQLAAGLLVAGLALPSHAATYKIDTEGAHAFVQFKIKHLGYSWLLGRFNTFEGSFVYDDKAPNKSSVNVTIDTASVDSNHAERDKHLRSKDFLDVKKFPQAVFKSTSFTVDKDDKTEADLVGELTLHGVTRSITIEVDKIGEGADPWGGHRVGFEGEVTLKLEDFGIKNVLGPASAEFEMELYVEGIRQ